jgi:NIMA-interacting peptidyl-prolyl cis-trans isomerase 4
MPKGAASKDKKSAEKKGGDKGKGKGKSEEAADKGGKVRTASIPGSFAHPVPLFFFFFLLCRCRSDEFQGKGGLKAATAVNVRHILCEKHSKATEALERIQVTYRCLPYLARTFLFLII